MEGFAFKTRRSIFADIQVREALGMMFDFEWINANFFYGGLYRRSRSFFDDSELASAGQPADAGERALLAAFPGAVRMTPSKDAGNRPLRTVRGATGRWRGARWRSSAKLATPSRTAFSSSERAAGRSPSRFSYRAARRNGFRGSMRTASSASAFTLPSASPMRCSTSTAAQKFDFDMDRRLDRHPIAGL
jgi:peptide/nickel transport system substrate-binding protein